MSGIELSKREVRIRNIVGLASVVVSVTSITLMVIGAVTVWNWMFA